MKRWRHLAVAIGIIPAFGIYIGFVLWLSSFIMDIHFLVDFLFFVIAGLAWIPASAKVVSWLAKHESE